MCTLLPVGMLTGSTVPDRLASCTSTRAPLPADGASEIVHDLRERIEVERRDGKDDRRFEAGLVGLLVDGIVCMYQRRVELEV